jgi:hypothetical protein
LCCFLFPCYFFSSVLLLTFSCERILMLLTCPSFNFLRQSI